MHTCICVHMSLRYNAQMCLPETATFCIRYSCPGKKIDKVTYTGLEREKLTVSPAVFRGEKAQSCGSGTELHMAYSELWVWSCQRGTFGRSWTGNVHLPWHIGALTGLFSSHDFQEDEQWQDAWLFPNCKIWSWTTKKNAASKFGRFFLTV